MSDPRRPFEWDDTKPFRVRRLFPLEPSKRYLPGRVTYMPLKELPVGEYLDKYSGEWVECTLPDYLRSIGWNA